MTRRICLKTRRICFETRRAQARVRALRTRSLRRNPRPAPPQPAVSSSKPSKRIEFATLLWPRREPIWKRKVIFLAQLISAHQSTPRVLTVPKCPLKVGTFRVPHTLALEIRCTGATTAPAAWRASRSGTACCRSWRSRSVVSGVPVARLAACGCVLSGWPFTVPQAAPLEQRGAAAAIGVCAPL